MVPFESGVRVNCVLCVGDGQFLRVQVEEASVLLWFIAVQGAGMSTAMKRRVFLLLLCFAKCALHASCFFAHEARATLRFVERQSLQ